MKKILILMLSVVLVFALSVSLFSCGDDTPEECTEHTDANSDGKCDNCEADMPKVPDGTEEPMTHAEFMAAEIGESVFVETYVQAKQGWWNNNGVDVATFYTENEEGGYFIYNMPCTEEEYNALVAGTKISVKGYKAIFNDLHEISDATFEIIEGDTYVAEPMDITDIIATDAVMNYQGMKYTVTLTVAEFKDGAAFGYGWDGSGTDGADIYFKLTDGTNTYSFVIETYLTGADSDVYAAAKALQIGDTITVEGFVYWYEGFQAHVTSITVEADTPAI